MPGLYFFELANNGSSLVSTRAAKMGCGASSSANDVAEPGQAPERRKKFGGWENEAGWGELGSVADPGTPQMDSLWQVLPAALSTLQLDAFQNVMSLNASDFSEKTPQNKPDPYMMHVQRMAEPSLA